MNSMSLANLEVVIIDDDKDFSDNLAMYFDDLEIFNNKINCVFFSEIQSSIEYIKAHSKSNIIMALISAKKISELNNVDFNSFEHFLKSNTQISIYFVQDKTINNGVNLERVEVYNRSDLRKIDLHSAKISNLTNSSAYQYLHALQYQYSTNIIARIIAKNVSNNSGAFKDMIDLNSDMYVTKVSNDFGGNYDGMAVYFSNKLSFQSGSISKEVLDRLESISFDFIYKDNEIEIRMNKCIQEWKSDQLRIVFENFIPLPIEMIRHIMKSINTSLQVIEEIVI